MEFTDTIKTIISVSAFFLAFITYLSLKIRRVASKNKTDFSDPVSILYQQSKTDIDFNDLFVFSRTDNGLIVRNDQINYHYVALTEGEFKHYYYTVYQYINLDFSPFSFKNKLYVLSASDQNILEQGVILSLVDYWKSLSPHRSFLEVFLYKAYRVIPGGIVNFYKYNRLIAKNMSFGAHIARMDLEDFKSAAYDHIAMMNR